MMHVHLFPTGVASVETLKEQAGIAACAFVSDGMALGLGTGSTVRYSIIEIARMIEQDGIEVTGVPTSEDTRQLAEMLGIPLAELHDFAEPEELTDTLDLTIDGADEFDSKFDLIKGGGGALTREKAVALSSKAMVVVADETKKVDTLGTFPLPVEVDQLMWESARNGISSLCSGPVILRGGEREPYVTDNSGYILDCSFGATISEPSSLESQICGIEGVVEVGLFVAICDAVVMASQEGVSTLMKYGGQLV